MHSFIIIGTAGHVDHGKTELVKALTGIDTDRLKEEKERGISIELGFAPLSLSGGIQCGVVDVPGHERFVKNMLAGAGGVDLVLFVVAADEGVMPQTREHLDILDLLHVQRGIIVLTKTDLVDEEWLLLVEDDVKELLKGTRLEGSPIVPVSTVSGQGLSELRGLLAEMSQYVQPKKANGPARLPVDRAFSITGFGTVVTGTLFSGKINTGQVLEILPQELQVRVRSLQVHGQKVEEAYAGQRVAANLAGVELEEIKRGDVLAVPAAFRMERRLTAHLHLLARPEITLDNWERVRFHLATKETIGRIRLLNTKKLSPGENCFIQLELEEPVVAAVHDRFILRAYSPVTTIGGGEIVEIGGLRYRRFRSAVVEQLERKLNGSPEVRVMEELGSLRKPVSVGELAGITGIVPEELARVSTDLEKKGEAVLFAVGEELYIFAASKFDAWREQATAAIGDYHRRFPLRLGMPKEELRSRLFSSLNVRLFQAFLEKWLAEGSFVLKEQVLTLPDFHITLTPERQEALQRLAAKLQETPFSPPDEEELLQVLREDDAELLQYGLQQGLVVKVADGIYFSKEAINEAWHLLAGYLQENQEVAVAEARNLLGTSRRYCIPLLEYFDRQKKTIRRGDKRSLYNILKR